MSKKCISSTVLKPRHLTTVLKAAMAAGDTMMIWGPGGIGKSDIVAQFADNHFPIRGSDFANKRIAELESLIACGQAAPHTLQRFKDSLLDQNTNLIDFRLASTEPTDIRGIPVTVVYWMGNTSGRQYFTEGEAINSGEKYARFDGIVWAPPAVFNLPANWKGIVFLDEANQAIPMVQAAAYSLFLNHKVGEITLPTGAFVLAAGNRDVDGGATFDMATPLRDRMTHVELEVDVDDFVTYAIKAGIDGTVVAFVKNQPDKLHTLNPKHPHMCGGASPRSWCRVSEYRALHNGSLFNYGTSDNRDRDAYLVARALVAGRVGEEEAHEYLLFCDEIMRMPDREMVLNGKIDKLVDEQKQKYSTSALYGYLINLTYAVGALNRQVVAGTLTEQELFVKVNTFFKFLDTNCEFYDVSEFFVVVFRALIAQGVNVRPDRVPVLNSILPKYQSALALR